MSEIHVLWSGIAIGLGIGVMAGGSAFGMWSESEEFSRHRQFCDCPKCAKWREQMREMSERKGAK